MDAEVLAALAEANRLRIVELLAEAPRPVGEIAASLGLRQPQATKHLQTLERARLVAVYPLGRRRIYALQPAPLRELRAWLTTFDRDHPSVSVLDHYRDEIEREQALLGPDGGALADRTLRLSRTLPAPIDDVWTRWTSAAALRRWWHPEHFTVAECEAHPAAGGRLRIVMQEADGTRHEGGGRYVQMVRPHELLFDFAPIGPDGNALLAARHRVRLTERDDRTVVSLRIRVTDISPAAIPALAGMRLGWRQLLDNLTHDLQP